MNAAEIANAFGGAGREGRDWRCDCPVHGGNSLTLRDGRDGLLLKCWGAGCDAREIFMALRRLRLIGGEGFSGKSPSDQHPLVRGDRGCPPAVARRIWNAARDARGSPVARYLAARGVAINPPPVLRWEPACRHPSRIYLPAMVAKVVNVDGELIGVHRAFLRADGSGKAHIEPNKAALCPIRGGAVRLASTAERLMVGEGSRPASPRCSLPASRHGPRSRPQG